MLRGGGDDGSEPEMCQRRDEHLEGRRVYVIMWGSTLLKCVRAMLEKRTARSVPVFLGYLTKQPSVPVGGPPVAHSRVRVYQSIFPGLMVRSITNSWGSILPI